MLGNLSKLLQAGQRGVQNGMQQATQSQQQGSIDRMPNGMMSLEGAYTNRPVQEDDFTFRPGGSFSRMPNGSTSLNGAMYDPRAVRLAEDDFTFNQPQQVELPIEKLRQVMSRMW